MIALAPEPEERHRTIILAIAAMLSTTIRMILPMAEYPFFNRQSETIEAARMRISLIKEAILIFRLEHKRAISVKKLAL